MKLQRPETTSASPDQGLPHLPAPGQAEAKYRAILATMMDGFALLDASGHILEANDAYCRMVGYSPEELVVPTHCRTPAAWACTSWTTALVPSGPLSTWLPACRAAPC